MFHTAAGSVAGSQNTKGRLTPVMNGKNGFHPNGSQNINGAPQKLPARSGKALIHLKSVKKRTGPPRVSSSPCRVLTWRYTPASIC